MRHAFSPPFDRPIPPAVRRAASHTVAPSLVQEQFAHANNLPDDAALADYLRWRVRQLEEPPPRRLPVDIYVAMSAMQKAVRLGDADQVARASATLIHHGELTGNWRRIRVIAVEDVGAGDPTAAAFVLWIAGQRQLQADLGHLALSRIALDILCRARKSRDMCDLHFWLNLPGVGEALVPGLVDEPVGDLIALAADEHETLRFRTAAARALFPAKPSWATRWTKHTRDERLEMYDRLAMPGPWVHMLEQDVKFGGDVLTSAGPMVWSIIAASATETDMQDPFDRDEDLYVSGGVLISAYDHHTRYGGLSQRTVLARHPALIDFFRRHPDAEPGACFRRAVFYTESGVLRPRLAFDGGLDLYWAILEAKFASTGILAMELGGWELLSHVVAALPDVHQARARTLFDFD